MRDEIKLDKSGYSTLTNYLLSCQVSIPEKTLNSFFNYKGSFPTTFREIIGEDFDILIDIPDIVFVNLIDFAEKHSFAEINDEAICLFFASKKHLETAKHSPITEKGLNYSQWIIGHLTWPGRVIEKENGLITVQGIDAGGKVDKDHPGFKKVIDLSGRAEVDSIVLVHFGIVVLVEPSQKLLKKLFDIRSEFHGEIPKISEIDYSLALKDTKKRLKKYLGH